jgi:DNA-binding NtrC family response regulator
MAEQARVLVVDDDPVLRKVLQGMLAQDGIPSLSAGSAPEALAAIDRHEIAVMVTDLKMPGMDGLELLERALAIDPSLQAILVTAHGTAEVAARAWELGACGYVRKPFERDEIAFEIRRALDIQERASPEAMALTSGDMIGSSAPMREVRALVAKVAPTSSTVLIRGESGTGKEIVARAIHAASRRAGQPFIKVVCAALPEALLESELFGYDKGAFTGATAGKPGRFELAEGGTLFLDEIGDLSPATQVKLLRVLQDRQYERLGGTETRTADVRILSATHRDLEALCREGRFREDLFYRINVVPVPVPPLRERPGDVRALAEHFLARFCREHQKPLRLRPGALDPLEAHPWPGNVRELQNVLERLVVLSDGALGAEDVARCLSPASPPSRAQAPAQLDQARAEAERMAIEDALRRTGGNRTAAARVLGISRRTLYNKMVELQMG